MTITKFEANYRLNGIDPYNIRAVRLDIKKTFLNQYPKVEKITSNEIEPWCEGEDELFITFKFTFTDSTYKQLMKYYPEALI